MKLWQIGLVLVMGGSFANGLFVTQEIHGLLREGMRLLIIAGVFLFIFGLIKSKKSHR